MAQTEPSQLSPDDAFAVLGNEVRIQILRILGEADRPLSYEEIQELVDITDSGHLNYHLSKLTGHFLREVDGRYSLYPAGDRILEAVLAGAIDEPIVIEPTKLDRQCPFCETFVDAAFANDRLYFLCDGCDGRYTLNEGQDLPFDRSDYGWLGQLPLPSAGVHDRSIDEVWRVVWTYGHLEVLATAQEICPRCTGGLEYETVVCESHEGTDGICEACGRRFGVVTQAACTNCNYMFAGELVILLMDELELLSFLIDHGVNPIKPDGDSPPKLIPPFADFEEEVHSLDPLEVEFTFRLDDEELSMRVNEDFEILESKRQDF